ncbi:DctP family TRAP transporter solute-binding subunit [Sinorhizobium alkalisoli]|uniref:C4-dicarboxylate ABC transporter substrate-binding protein n=1 Tax=Sinorhizobium alkalisoli TaxID=1752398 RepID=A0A1E3V864_9HYPH|nr:DctP family TRAP transporter solute-binding subunit [Sinorhizobium alkalisoli]MCG5480413.1 DctP family TRAP transporter solute-binding subunit [Sinorhizobium alkalisoli]ODR89655.1 C4-dicarboxylate ABC transporter substrate-binding protein [Sinorhizobium alkalisoli]
MNTLMKTVGLAAALTLSAVPALAETVLKLAHAAPETDLQQTMSIYFKEQVEARSGGSITVNVFPHGQLGNDAQMIDGARSGIIDIAISGLNNFTGLIPEAGAFELPFMFPSRDLAYRVLDGEIGQGVAAKFEPVGLKLLGFPENGYRNITNNRGPVRTPEDLDGLQMRVNNSKALNDMFALLGANPQQLPVAELYTALETGVVDAQDHPIGIVVSFKFNEVQKYLSLTQHAYSALAMVMNNDKLKGLSDAEQKIIMEVAAEAVAKQRELSVAKEEEMIAQLESEGMSVNRDVDAAAFQAAVKPVWEGFIDENGDALVNAIVAASK